MNIWIFSNMNILYEYFVHIILIKPTARKQTLPDIDMLMVEAAFWRPICQSGLIVSLTDKSRYALKEPGIKTTPQLDGSFLLLRNRRTIFAHRPYSTFYLFVYWPLMWLFRSRQRLSSLPGVYTLTCQQRQGLTYVYPPSLLHTWGHLHQCFQLWWHSVESFPSAKLKDGNMDLKMSSEAPLTTQQMSEITLVAFGRAASLTCLC